MTNRPCCRVTCSRPAVATLTFDYEDRLAVVGPLAMVADPHASPNSAEQALEGNPEVKPLSPQNG